MTIINKFNKQDIQAIREALLDLKRFRLDSLLYEAAVDITISREKTLESYALERAHIDGFCRAIQYIFEEMTNE